MALKPAPLAFALLLLLPLSGCTSPAAKEEPPTTVVPPPPEPEFDYVAATWPTGQAAYDYVASYIMTHPNRRGTSDAMTMARDDLEALLQGFGLKTHRHEYASGVNILGILEGTERPDEWVVLSAHYDTAVSTLFGAWDDGAGVAALLALAQELATWEFPFTLVFAFFDQEENGLVGSGAFVQWAGDMDNVDLVANLNTDPPGLNWPCGDPAGPFLVLAHHNLARVEDASTPRFKYLYDAVESGLARAAVPQEVRDYSGDVPILEVGGEGLGGTSDHAQFDRAEIANVFLGGAPVTEAGPVTAMTYALHTPIDTLQQMEARCTGGEGTLADGLHTIVITMAQALVYMAQNEVPPPTALSS